MDLGSFSRCALALLPVCVPTASAVASGRRVSASCSDARTAPLHPDQSALRQGYPAELGLGSSTPVRRAVGPTPSPKFYYYIKLEDEEPREVAGGPAHDGPPARLGQCAQTGPET